MVYPDKVESINKTKSKVEQLRERQMFATAAGALVGSMFGGAEGGAAATGTIRKSMDDEYNTQIQELGRQESLLEAERQFNSNQVLQIKLAKLSAFNDQIGKGIKEEDAMYNVYNKTGGIEDALLIGVSRTKTEKQAREFLQSQPSYAKLETAAKDRLDSVIKLNAIEKDKSKPGYGAWSQVERAALAFRNPNTEIFATEGDTSLAKKNRDIISSEESHLRKKAAAGVQKKEIASMVSKRSKRDIESRN